ncbi:hypothetical protein [Paenibacillus bovis]|uniref:Uncharacterized protein n=1 Tax=Paenibacillus bovis TaxID=1616788 RepID=A0A1X9T491_9BACL|nr:hypothetical protein [Paenibacillus bovis]ARR10714.1 hypothetical protein AR543_p0106 [Paenibacillus bovis]
MDSYIKANYKATHPIYQIGDTITVPDLPEKQDLIGIIDYRIVRGRIVVRYSSQDHHPDRIPLRAPAEEEIIHWDHIFEEEEILRGLTTGDFQQIDKKYYQISRICSLNVVAGRLNVAAWALPILQVPDVSKELVSR